VFRLNEYIPQLKKLTGTQHLFGAITLTSPLKALSGTTLRTVKASPVQLRAIAESIANEPYVPGTNDCQTWFLRALSELEHYQVGEKSLDEMTIDTLTCTVGVASKPLIECASGGTSAVSELVKSGMKLGAADGNAVELVTTGSTNSVNYLINGVARGAGAGLDSAGAAFANMVGLATLGGFASKNPDANVNSETATGPAQAIVQRVGHAAGNIVYGVSGAAKSVAEGVGGVATTAVSSATEVVGTSVAQAGKGFVAGLKSFGALGKQQ
jgi:hypothetical protein